MTDDAPALALDHVNLRTGRLREMVAWYRDVLGLTEGWRPDFGFPGAWLYAGRRAVVHLVGVDATPAAAAPDLRIEHFALEADGALEPFLARLERLGVAARLARVPAAGITQVNIFDPDGNHVHIDFWAPGG